MTTAARPDHPTTHSPRPHPPFGRSHRSSTSPPASSRFAPKARKTAKPNLVQLVTRVPLKLRQRARLHCARRTSTLTRFVTEAIVERLAAEARGGAAR